MASKTKTLTLEQINARLLCKMGGGFYYHTPDPNPLNKVEEARDGWSHGFEVTRRGGSEGDNGDDDECEMREIVGLELGHHFGRSSTRKIASFAMENWLRMGNDVCVNCSSLRRIDLSGADLSLEAIAAIFVREVDRYACPLESLDLTSIELGAEGMAAMLPFLRSMSKTLRYLYLNDTGLGRGGTKSLSTMLKYDYDRLHELGLASNNMFDEGAKNVSAVLDRVRVDTLHLGYNGIGDVGIQRLLSARNSRHLGELYIENNRIERHDGYDTIAHFLGREDAEMRILRMGSGHRISRMGSGHQELYRCHLRTLVRGLSNNANSKLEVLGLSNIDKSHLGLTLGLQNLVCDTSSFQSLLRSNHRLRVRWVNDYMSDFDPFLKKAFRINALPASTNQRARSKLRNFYFRGDFCVQPFLGMDAALMPRVLHLLTVGGVWADNKEGYHLVGEYNGDLFEVPSNNVNGVYRLVRNCLLPELFSFLPPSSL